MVIESALFLHFSIHYLFVLFTKRIQNA